MYYSLIGLLALLTLLITNHDVLFRKPKPTDSSALKVYRVFLITVIVYYTTDMLWGILDSLNVPALLFADTELYFLAMALGNLFWALYVIAYLGEGNSFRKVLKYAGIALVSCFVVITVINLFFPVLFWLDEAGEYHAGVGRHALLIAQIVLLLMSSGYALIVSGSSEGTTKNRHLTIGLSGLVMAVFIAVQFFFPNLPFYAIGFMLSCCLLRTFVVENERESYRSELEEALRKEREQVSELNEAWRLAYTDALTGVKSKLLYGEKQDQIDRAIDGGIAGDFAVAIFDVNGLKRVNDTMGHDVGDEYIREACRLICAVFSKSPVYRVGGDEFVAVLEGEDYRNREELIREFNRQIDENRKQNGVVVAAGITEFIPEWDTSFKRTFDRADMIMYARKKELKRPVRKHAAKPEEKPGE